MNLKKKTFLTKSQILLDFKSILNFDKLISLIGAFFFLSYYFAIPIFIKDGKEEISFDINVILFSTITILFLPYLTRKLKLLPNRYFLVNYNSQIINLTLIFISFLFFSFYLNIFSWSGDKGLFYSISALFRVIWLYYGIQINNNVSRKYTLSYLLMTIVLGFIDQQRTHTLLCLFIAFFQLRLNYIVSFFALVVIFFTLTLTAAVRSNQGFDVIGSIYFSIAGEAFLATRSYVEAFGNVDFTLLEKIYHLFYLFLSPLIVLINKFFSYIPFLNNNFLIVDLFQERFGQYNHTGGHFISSTFLPFGSLQFIIQPLYFIFTYTITRRIIGPLSVPLSSILFILCIKNTPFYYWNLVFIILVFGYLFKFIRKIKLV